MRHRFSCFAVVLLLGCSRPAVLKPDPEAHGAPTPPTAVALVDAGESAKDCTLPASPEHLVLAIARTVVPIGAEIRHERGEITARGVCSPGVECAKVPDAALDAQWTLFARASRVRHMTTKTSPHYGSRTILARWVGGTCEISDHTGSQVTKEDWDTFYASFDGIVGAVVAGRPDAGKK